MKRMGTTFFIEEALVAQHVEKSGIIIGATLEMVQMTAKSTWQASSLAERVVYFGWWLNGVCDVTVKECGVA